MREYLNIGPCPAEENCVQVGEHDYERRSRAECQRFIDLIRNKIGHEPPGAQLAIKSFPHDLGSYLEVVCYYDDENSAAYAFTVESDAPSMWND